LFRVPSIWMYPIHKVARSASASVPPYLQSATVRCIRPQKFITWPLTNGGSWTSKSMWHTCHTLSIFYAFTILFGRDFMFLEVGWLLGSMTEKVISGGCLALLPFWPLVRTLGCGPIVGSPLSSSALPSLGRSRITPPQEGLIASFQSSSTHTN